MPGCNLKYHGMIHQLAVVALAGIFWLSACSDQPDATRPVTETTAQKPQVTAAGYNFTPKEASGIIGNAQHEIHTGDAQLSCESCHRQEGWITHEQALALCVECHESQIVADEVWENHCLSCHQFTNYAEHYASSVHILREQCQDCHGLDSVVYTAFDPSSEHDITCDNCHRPHETSLVYSGDLCKDCHEDEVMKADPVNRVHGSCLVCHSPHSELNHSGELCTKCHYASSDVLMHNVPGHPTDCLACHSAHFSSTEVGDTSCLVCHDDTFYGGESNLPPPHRDCTNCHYVNNFTYKGDDTCIQCHPPEESTLHNNELPEEHSTCETCHQPHQWYASFENTCERCHDVDSVIEHQLSFHQHECGTCHNPHSIQTMAKSGHCEGCHQEQSYPMFAANTPSEHLACENCHDQVAIDSRRFTFTGPAESCLLCHPYPDMAQAMNWGDMPFGHQVCNMCHQPHTFKITTQSESCNLCHIDLYAGYPAAEHAECLNCHNADHEATFAGQDVSCELCHVESVSSLANVESHALDCDACHTIHAMEEPSGICADCHPALPGLHGGHIDISAGVTTDCSDCHGAHAFGVEAVTCTSCHPELEQTCSTACMDCHTFNEV